MPKELVSMKLSRGDYDTEGRREVAEIERPQYSYGLVLRLERPELKKLGMDGDLPEVGDEFEIVAKGKVNNVHVSQSEGNRDDKAIAIQITDLALK